MEEFPELETNRLKLVQIQQEDADALFTILSSKRVTQYYGMEPLTRKQDAKNMIASFAAMFEQKRGIRWGMVCKNTGAFIGSIGLNNLFYQGKRAEIGFELHPDYWRQGFMKEAAEKVIQFAFDERHLHRLGAVTFQENTASRKLLEKLGFQVEGTLRGYIYQASRHHDAMLYSLLAPDRKKSKQQSEREIDTVMTYTDHLTEIIRKAERQGDFDNLPGKGKPLDLGNTYFSNSYERQMYKTMKDNHVLPEWVRLGKEIDAEKEKLANLKGKERSKKIKQINKKIKAYNYACPPSLQRNKLFDE